jgi:hypothetical protein
MDPSMTSISPGNKYQERGGATGKRLMAQPSYQRKFTLIEPFSINMNI